MTRAAAASVALLMVLGATAGPSAVRAEAFARDVDLQRIDLALRKARDNRKAAIDVVGRIVKQTGKTSSRVFANSREVSHRIGGGQVLAAMPDVCRSPSPAGPVPIPYPDLGKSSDTARKSKKVKTKAKLPSPAAVSYFPAAAETAAENSSRLLDHLEAIRQLVDAQARFVGNLCRGCRLKEGDERYLKRSLASSARKARETLPLLDRSIRDIKRFRAGHRRHARAHR